MKSAHLEQAALMFNMAALHSQIAAHRPLDSSDDARKQSAIGFQVRALCLSRIAKCAG